MNIEFVLNLYDKMDQELSVFDLILTAMESEGEKNI